MPKFLVRTVSTFYHTYVVDCEEAGHASDTIVTADENILELHQEHVDEQILEVEPITDAKQIERFRAAHPYSTSWTDEEILSRTTNQVDYSWRSE